MRFDYVKYDEQSTNMQIAFNKKFGDLAETLEALPDSREKSLVLTKLEEAYMWIGKAIRDEQIARIGYAPSEETRSDS
jgi:hypothetical protein